MHDFIPYTEVFGVRCSSVYHGASNWSWMDDSACSTVRLVGSGSANVQSPLMHCDSSVDSKNTSSPAINLAPLSSQARWSTARLHMGVNDAGVGMD